jgi:hypothetical protein
MTPQPSPTTHCPQTTIHKPLSTNRDHHNPPQAELPDLLDALDGSAPAAAVPEGLALELGEVASIGGAAHLRGVSPDS